VVMRHDALLDLGPIGVVVVADAIAYALEAGIFRDAFEEMAARDLLRLLEVETPATDRP
jgi:hypothetical protein